MFDLFFTPFTRANLKWIIDLNVKYKNTKFLKDVIGESLNDLGFDNHVVHKYNTKSKSTIYERKKNVLKLRIFVLQKLLVIEWKDKIQNRRIIFA